MTRAPSSKTATTSRDHRPSTLAAQRTTAAGFRTPDAKYLQNLFAGNVRLVRVARGLSQEELAERASLDRTYISSIERRLRNLSIQNIQRLALALDIDPRDLLNPDLASDARYRS